jgi:hypothetical protein
MGTVLTTVLGAVTQEGVKRLSKTKLAVNTGGLNAIAFMLPAALNGDPTAIGQIVIAVVTCALALWGRGTKG